MALVTTEIKFYSVKFSSGTKNPEPCNAIVYLATHSTYGAIMLYFMPDAVALPTNYTERKEKDKLYHVYYHEKDMWLILDMLRNERPVFFFFNEANNVAGVRSGSEPVGETED